MFDEHYHYGHADILYSYCKVSGRPIIPGRLQHGWNQGTGVSKKELSEPWPFFLWSERNIASCREAGAMNTVGVGAPFLYLPELDEVPEPEPKSLVVFPFHGWEKRRLHGNIVRYADSLQELRREGFDKITVCLYWMEYEDPEVREVMKSRGFELETMGHRDTNPGFLERQRRLILRHAYATSNRVSTVAFYALALGRPFFYYGPAMGLSTTDDPTGRGFDAWQRSEFPMLDFNGFDDRVHREVGEDELGLEFKLSPEAMCELFLWNRSDRYRRWAVRARKAWWNVSRRAIGR